MNRKLRPLKIGSVTLPNNLILAPMAGVTDLPFRLLCSRQGAGMCCMEMVSAKAILYQNKNTESLLEIHPEEGMLSMQLFGSDPKILSEMAKKIEDRPFAVLDINMGCPVPKVVNNGEGSALMKNPQLVEQIVSAVVKAVDKPVTVKIRKGFDEAHVVKEAVSIPVIGNGDVTDGASAAALLEQTGCDGVMVGRAARGNPWIFSQIAAWLEDGTIPPRPDIEEVKQTILYHAQLQLTTKGEYTAIREMRKHVSWYTSGYPNSARLRQVVNQTESFEELCALVEEL